jgi:F0F1-type ATP synthase membrane subunit b/b'
LLLTLAPAAVGAEEHAEGGDGDHAAEEAGGHHSTALNWIDFDDPHSSPLVAMIANFVLLLIIVWFLLRRPIGGMVKHRHYGLAEALEEAREQKEAAEQALAAARAQMEALDAEIEKVRKQIIEAGEAEANGIRRDSAQRTERLQADTKAVIEQEVARMSQVIREEVVEGIVAAAEKLVREKIQRSDQDRLAREYLEEIGKQPGDQAGR